MGNTVQKFARCVSYSGAEEKNKKGEFYTPDTANEWYEETVGQCFSKIETWQEQTVAEQLDGYKCETEMKDIGTWNHKKDEFTVVCTGVSKTAPATNPDPAK